MRKDQKKLSLALDGDTYRALRLLALDLGQTGQDIMERALKDYLIRHEWLSRPKVAK
jgi:predicted transcriptional regulator